MKKGEYKEKHGFTIIEVSLVLAIAGLILVMVFIALPALQRQQRDAQRKEDALALVTAIKKYQQNNRGVLPWIECEENTGAAHDYDDYSYNFGEKCDQLDLFLNEYLGDNFVSPAGEYYELLGEVKSRYRSTLRSWGEHISNNGIEQFYGTPEGNENMFFIFNYATCDGSGAVESSNPRSAAVVYVLESGGWTCVNT